MSTRKSCHCAWCSFLPKAHAAATVAHAAAKAFQRSRSRRGVLCLLFPSADHLSDRHLASTSTLSPPRAQPAQSTSTSAGTSHPAPAPEPATCLHHVHSQFTAPAPAPGMHPAPEPASATCLQHAHGQLTAPAPAPAPSTSNQSRLRARASHCYLK